MTESPPASVVAEIRVPAERVVLADALSAAPEVVVEFEQFVPTGSTPTPFLWAVGAEGTRFEAVVGTDPTVSEVRLVDAVDGDNLLRVEWVDGDDSLLGWFEEGDERILRAVGQDDEWFLETRFAEREALSAFQQHCERRDVDFDLLRLYETRAPKLGRYDLTGLQRDALVTALEMGYFDVPRRATLAEVADELGLSPNAVSERIRRSEANPFRSALTTDRPPHRDRAD